MAFWKDTGCATNKFPSLKWIFSKSIKNFQTNSFALKRGKANLNFDVSYFKFTSLFEKLEKKNFYGRFQKTSFFIKKQGIKSQKNLYMEI